MAEVEAALSVVSRESERETNYGQSGVARHFAAEFMYGILGSPN